MAAFPIGLASDRLVNSSYLSYKVNTVACSWIIDNMPLMLWDQQNRVVQHNLSFRNQLLSLVQFRWWLSIVFSSRSMIFVLMYKSCYNSVTLKGQLPIRRFGHRPCLMASVVLNVLNKTVQLLSPSATVYLISRVPVALNNVGRYTTAYVLGKYIITTLSLVAVEIHGDTLPFHIDERRH